MGINYELIQQWIESHSSEMQKNQLDKVFADTPEIHRAMLAEFFMTDLKINPLEYMTVIPDGMFINADYLSGEIVIPANITQIGKDAFSHTLNLSKVNFECPIKEIAQGTFTESGITEVVIPEGVTIIGQDAFRYCKNLTMVQLPSTIQTIHRTAFVDGNPQIAIGIPKTSMKAIQGLKMIRNPQTGKLNPDANDPLTAFYMSALRPQ